MDPIFRVRPWAGGWGVFEGEDAEPRNVDPLRGEADAVSHAKELARRVPGGAQICVFGPNGALVSEFFYQHDERASLERDDSVASFAASQPATRGQPRPGR